ncbi:MAG: hypothetical protein ACI857_001653 [Arenicella sp.]|jgi:hypothetical protein
MMKKLLLIISLIFSAGSGFSQNSTLQPQNVVVGWEVGTVKRISQIDSTMIYANDTLFLATALSSNYTMKIMSQKDTVYEVLFKQINLDDDPSAVSEMIDATPIQKMMQELMKKLQDEMAGLEYSFLVDQNTALAFEVKNQEELSLLIEELVVVVLNQILDSSKIKMKKDEKNEIALKVKDYMADQMPAAMQTMLNAFNYLFQAYSFPFVIDETYSQEIEVYDVDEVQHGVQENKAMLVVNSSETDAELLIDYEYVYDKEEAYQTYIVSQGKAQQISLDEFEIDERVISKFNLETSWIKSSTSRVNAKMGDISVHNISKVVIK